MLNDMGVYTLLFDKLCRIRSSHVHYRLGEQQQIDTIQMIESIVYLPGISHVPTVVVVNVLPEKITDIQLIVPGEHIEQGRYDIKAGIFGQMTPGFQKKMTDILLHAAEEEVE